MKRGFDVLDVPQTYFRDCILRKRIPDLLYEGKLDDQRQREAAEYIWELEAFILEKVENFQS